MNERRSNHRALKGQHKKNVFNMKFADVKMLSYPSIRHEHFIENWSCNATHSWGNVHAPVILLPGKGHPKPTELESRLVPHHVRKILGMRKIHILLLPEIEPRFLWCPAYSVKTVTFELPRLILLMLCVNLLITFQSHCVIGLCCWSCHMFVCICVYWPCGLWVSSTHE